MNKFNLSEEQLKKDIRQAFRLWNKGTSVEAPLSYLMGFKMLQKKESNVRRATNQLLSEPLIILETQQRQYAQVLQQRYIDGISVRQVADRTSSCETSVYRWQREGIAHLAKIIYERELELRSDKDEAYIERERILEEQLGPPSTNYVIGIQPHINHLTEVLTLAKSPWIVCLSGMGGIGKTTLADMLLRQIISQGDFTKFGWASTQQQVFSLRGRIERKNNHFWTVDSLIQKLVRELLHIPTTHLSPDQALRRLRRGLKEQSHLIVLDNLETLQDIENLVPTLHSLANPTKFLLTSRNSLYLDPDVYNYQVPELNQENTLELIREEARVRNLPYLIGATNEKLARIYKIVGGNPLVLRLIVGQTHIHDVDTVLDDLKKARGTKTEQLYIHLYRRAWYHLDDLSRRIFLITPNLVGEGKNRQFLQTMSGLSAREINHALDLLVTLNLVNVKQGNQEWLYSIDSLTRTFLEKQVLKWR